MKAQSMMMYVFQRLILNKIIMKKIILLKLFFSIYFYCYSQDTVQLYLNNQFLKVSKDSAILQRTAVIKNNHYYITDKYLNGTLINYSEFISVNPLIEDGLSKHYDEYGKLYSTGNYFNGKLSGQWLYYSSEKVDTVNYESVESYYKYLPDSCKNEYLSSIKLSKTEAIPVEKSIADFFYKTMQIPARARNENFDREIRTKFLIDTDGFIKCPEIIDSAYIDLKYEVLRTLFLYKSNLKLDSPVQLELPIKINSDRLIDEEPIFFTVEENAAFQGGDINKFRLWVQQNLVYPIEAAEAKIQGKVIVQFVVSSKGFVVDTKVVRGVNPILDNEAVRCIKSSPKWFPGKQAGRAVNQQFTIPIVFQIN